MIKYYKLWNLEINSTEIYYIGFLLKLEYLIISSIFKYKISDLISISIIRLSLQEIELDKYNRNRGKYDWIMIMIIQEDWSFIINCNIIRY